MTRRTVSDEEIAARAYEIYLAKGQREGEADEDWMEARAELEGFDRNDGVNGSEVAPTKQAAEREHERHALEREIGRVAAGGDTSTEVRSAGATRERLDEAAREADRRVTGHSVPSASTPGRGGQASRKSNGR
jgi:hypothetical protein